MQLNPNVYPSGGYLFKESDGAIIRGPSWKSVLRKVEKYRQNAGLPIGNVAAEVTAQACKRSPTSCNGNQPVAMPRATRNQKPSLKARMLAWLVGMANVKEAQKSIGYVSNNDAVVRANICATCPANTPAIKQSCTTCVIVAEELRAKIIGDRKMDHRVDGCDLLGIDLKSAVHLDEVRIDGPELPAHCWRRIEL